ncbi:MAG: sugar phosphate isomerase/epimerase [Cyclobacteriaceae bacterium]|nr:sugar phosphate isomerase/epimerase [Cyclobacteriaceae bacterium]
MRTLTYYLSLLVLVFAVWSCGKSTSADAEGEADSTAVVKEQPAATPLFPDTPGIQTYSFRASFARDVANALDTIKHLGFTEVECGLDPYGLTTEEFKKMLDDRGIKATSVGAGYDQIVENPEEVAQKANIMGAKYVMVAWIPHKDAFTIDDAKKAVEDFNRVGKVLKENGVTLCYHNHGYEFVPYEDGTLFDYIAENTDPEYVSFEMDILWVTHPGADPVQLLEKYGNRWKLMHLKDLRAGVPSDFSGHTPVENDVVLGTGVIDIPAVLKAAKKAGVEHYYIEDESPTVGEQVPQSLEYLKGLTE